MSALGSGEVRLRLRSLLREIVDPQVDFSQSPTPLSGGAFSANYLFEATHVPAEWSGRLVLRLLPSGFQARIEAGLQTGARDAGVPAPRVVHVEPAGDVLGAPFIVMELLAGRGFLRGIEWYRFARDFPKLLWSWPSTFADTLRLLSTADSRPVLDALSREDFPEQSVLTTRHLSWIKENAAEGELLNAVEWLNANQPVLPNQLSLVHGDLWPANVLMARGRICGLVDWTRGAVGDPALDVGFAKVGLALMPEPFPPPPPFRAIARASGVRMATQVHERCAPIVGGDERVAYYEGLRCVLQIAEVFADRRIGLRNSWEHGVPALAHHFNTISGLNAFAS